MPILSWLIRPLLVVAAIIAGWFVAEDAVNFTIVQMVVAVVLIAALVGVAALWEVIADRIREARKPTRPVR
jgi:hypothetical protein